MSIKYEKIDWSGWPEPPQKDLYDDWVKARKSKKHPDLTQTSINKYGKHVTRIVNDNVCSVTMAVEFAAENGWRAIMYNYVVNALHREMDNYSYHPPASDTRSIPIDRQLTNTDWAIPVELKND